TARESFHSDRRCRSDRTGRWYPCRKHRTYQTAGAAGDQTVLTQECDQRLDIVILDALKLHGQTGGHGNGAGTELFGSFCNGMMLCGGNFAVAGNDTDVEYVIISLVLETAQTLYTLDFFRAELGFGA